MQEDNITSSNILKVLALVIGNNVQFYSLHMINLLYCRSDLNAKHVLITIFLLPSMQEELVIGRKLFEMLICAFSFGSSCPNTI